MNFFGRNSILEEVHCEILLHGFYITSFDKHEQSLSMGRRIKKTLNTLKEKISTTPVLALLYLQQPFDIETDASGYAIGEVLMQHKEPIYYHSQTFSKTIINYPTYDKEWYALVQSVNKWKHYLMG